MKGVVQAYVFFCWFVPRFFAAATLMFSTMKDQKVSLGILTHFAAGEALMASVLVEGVRGWLRVS